MAQVKKLLAMAAFLASIDHKGSLKRQSQIMVSKRICSTHNDKSSKEMMNKIVFDTKSNGLENFDYRYFFQSYMYFHTNFLILQND